MLVQCFANGATGLSLFTDGNQVHLIRLDPDHWFSTAVFLCIRCSIFNWSGYVDDPGVYLAFGEAIGIAAQFEDIILNGSVARSMVTVTSVNAQGSAIFHKATSRAFIAVRHYNHACILWSPIHQCSPFCCRCPVLLSLPSMPTIVFSPPSSSPAATPVLKAHKEPTPQSGVTVTAPA